MLADQPGIRQHVALDQFIYHFIRVIINFLAIMVFFLSSEDEKKRQPRLDASDFSVYYQPFDPAHRAWETNLKKARKPPGPRCFLWSSWASSV